MESGDRTSSGDRPSWSRADTAWLLAIGLIGLGLRLAFVLDYASDPIGRLPWVDEGAYWTRAVEIFRGGWLPPRPFYQDPLFPYVLAGLMKLVGPGIAPLRIALACLGSLTPMVVFLAGRRGLGRAEGVLAGLVAAAYGPLVFTDGLLEKEGLGALLASAGLWGAARAAGSSGRSRPAWLLASGWAWGLVSLLRANAMVVAPFGVAWAWRLGERPKVRFLLASCFGVGFGLAILPAVAINAHVGRPPELLVTTWQSGANFYIGNGEGATGTYRAPEFVEANPAREADDFAAEASRRSGRSLTPGQVSRFWFVRGLDRWRESPGASLRLLGTKLGLLLNDFELPDNQDIAFVRLVAAPRLAWAFVGFGWLIPWAAVGLFRAERPAFRWFLAASTVAGLGSTAAFFVVARYRIPWVPGLALLGASGAVDLARRARDRRWVSLLGRVALIGVPVAALAWRPMADPVPDRWGHAEIVLAVAELGESHLEPAIDALDDARAFNSGAAGRVSQITSSGPVHDRLAELIRSRVALNRGRDDIPRWTRARWLRQVPEGRDEARRLLESALADDPADRQALRERAGWRLGEPGDPEARRLAAEDLSRAALGPAGDPSASILRAILGGRADFLPRPDDRTRALLSPRLPLAETVLSDARGER